MEKEQNKIMICYYSRDGHTRRIAHLLSEKLKADIFEVEETKSRKGIIGWLSLGNAGVFNKSTAIKSLNHDPAEYQTVVIATPKYMNLAPPIRSYIKQYNSKFKQIACIATTGETNADSLFKEVEDICGKSLISKEYLIRNDFSSRPLIETKIDNFVRRMEEQYGK